MLSTDIVWNLSCRMDLNQASKANVMNSKCVLGKGEKDGVASSVKSNQVLLCSI